VLDAAARIVVAVAAPVPKSLGATATRVVGIKSDLILAGAAISVPRCQVAEKLAFLPASR
jgi:hypothetical protein